MEKFFARVREKFRFGEKECETKKFSPHKFSPQRQTTTRSRFMCVHCTCTESDFHSTTKLTINYSELSFGSCPRLSGRLRFWVTAAGGNIDVWLMRQLSRWNCNSHGNDNKVRAKNKSRENATKCKACFHLLSYRKAGEGEWSVR
jgi:hypothetical protein